MSVSLPASGRPKNLFVFHLESTSWQTFNAFPEAFANLRALMGDARTYRRHYSSATSTQMVMAAFLHGNDFEMDAKPGISPPAGNNPSLFTQLEDKGYETSFLCATAFPRRPILHRLSGSLPGAWKTNDFAELLGAFEDRTAQGPFAIYVWCQPPHIEADLALASYARNLDELVEGSCAIADNLLGAMIEILRRAGTLEETTTVVFGDHGDDHGTHGFKNGLLHAVEPYPGLIHTPLVIRDPRLPIGADNRLVSNTDLASTCLDLLGAEGSWPFPQSGQSLLAEGSRALVFSQNLTANQPDMANLDVRKCFAAIDHSHALLVSSRGLELYNHRLDPGGHHNLLHHFDLDAAGRLTRIELPTPPHSHFTTVRHMWRSGALQDDFAVLRKALTSHVTAKNAYVKARSADASALLDLTALDTLSRVGRETYFTLAPATPHVAKPRPRWKKWLPRIFQPRPKRRPAPR
ncbi:sulfatase-like hydrolase/transferase [Ancylobacter sp.]|uniref:sulfatase-like hydrolase/transferase n=1 Tax=Ancylobacter sp. TaxID=1872567 RepID=UPI003D0F3571